MNRLNEPAQKKRYQTVLRELMTYVDDIAYAKDHDFEMAQLAQLKPHDIYRWMCTKAFDMPDPGPDDHPVHGRSSSLMYYKKAMSNTGQTKATTIISQWFWLSVHAQETFIYCGRSMSLV
jgi:hypothetical protein